MLFNKKLKKKIWNKKFIGLEYAIVVNLSNDQIETNLFFFGWSNSAGRVREEILERKFTRMLLLAGQSDICPFYYILLTSAVTMQKQYTIDLKSPILIFWIMQGAGLSKQQGEPDNQSYHQLWSKWP